MRFLNLQCERKSALLQPRSKGCHHHRDTSGALDSSGKFLQRGQDEHEAQEHNMFTYFHDLLPLCVHFPHFQIGAFAKHAFCDISCCSHRSKSGSLFRAIRIQSRHVSGRMDCFHQRFLSYHLPSEKHLPCPKENHHV